MIPIVTALLGKGLDLVANAVMAKGKDWVENKLGVELKPDMTSEDYAKLKIAEMQHEEELLKLKLVGFNCRRYDNHILYARAVMGFDNAQLYQLSQRIIG